MKVLLTSSDISTPCSILPISYRKSKVIEATSPPLTLAMQPVVRPLSVFLLEPFPFTGGIEEIPPGQLSLSPKPLLHRSVVCLVMLQVTLADENISQKYVFAA